MGSESSTANPSLRAALAATACLAALAPAAAGAAPDPAIAATLSAVATVVPIGVGTLLWTTGRGTDEGLRFDLGLTLIGVGAIAGPSTGQLYAESVGEGLLTFGLRLVTGGVMLAGLGLLTRGGDDLVGVGQALSVVGGIPTGLLAGYDVFAAASNARQAGYRRGHAPRAELGGDPIVQVGPFSVCGAAPSACLALR